MAHPTARIKQEETIRLVPQIPFIIAWLRHSEARPSDLFLGDATQVGDEEVMQSFGTLLEALETYGDLTTAQLRQICQEKPAAVWVRAIHTLFHGSDPRIVTARVTKALFVSFGKIKRQRDGNEVALQLSSDLDKLRLISKEALGELCAMIRDTSSKPAAVAAFIGHSVFLGQDNASPAERKTASLLMQAMVEHAELLFGKAASRSQFDPLGVRPRDYLKPEQRERQNSDPKDLLEDAGFM